MPRKFGKMRRCKDAPGFKAPKEGETVHLKASGKVQLKKLPTFKRLGSVRDTKFGRLVHVIRVQPTAERIALEENLEDYLERLENSSMRDDGRARDCVHLVASGFRKVAASSPAALLGMVERRICRLQASGPACISSTAFGSDETGVNSIEEPALMSLAFFPGEPDHLQALSWHCRPAIEKEAKIVALESVVGRITLKQSGKVVIFTEYLDTQDMIVRALSHYPGIEVAKIRGGMKPTEFHGEIERFNGAANVLVCTDVASEGLNLHHRCSTVVHYDSHWNAQRLEQRNGRVHRYGQTKTVDIYVLQGDDTHDRRIRQVEEAGLKIACLDLATVSAEFEYEAYSHAIKGDASTRADLCTVLASRVDDKAGGVAETVGGLEAEQTPSRDAAGCSTVHADDLRNGPALTSSVPTTADIMRFVADMGPSAGLGVRIIDAARERFELDFSRWPTRRYREFEGADVVAVTTNRKTANAAGESVVLLLFKSGLVQDLVHLALNGTLPPATRLS